MKRTSTMFKKLLSLIPFSSSLLLALLIKTGLTSIDPNTLSKATPRL